MGKRPTGRVCRVCKDRQPYDVFIGKGQICQLCRAVRAHAVNVSQTCVTCAQVFEAHQTNARYCSNPCRNRAHSRRRRQARRVAKLALHTTESPFGVRKYSEEGHDD